MTGGQVATVVFLFWVVIAALVALVFGNLSQLREEPDECGCRARAKEKVGACEICGFVDHHLIDGVCNVCKSRMRWIDVPANDTAMGDESARPSHAASKRRDRTLCMCGDPLCPDGIMWGPGR